MLGLANVLAIDQIYLLVEVMLTVNVCYDHSDFLQYSNQPDISQCRNLIVRANESKVTKMANIVTNGKYSDKWQI